MLAKIPKDSAIAVDENSLSYGYSKLIKELGHKLVPQGKNIIMHMKAKKNPVQQDGMRNANKRDVAAIMKYFAFLEEELKKPDHGIDEYIGAKKVLEYRKQHEMFI